MHVQNHIEECQYLFSLNYAESVGRLDGEEAERWWSVCNMAAGSTKQMNPGSRMDTLDDMCHDWNINKQFTAGKIAKV